MITRSKVGIHKPNPKYANLHDLTPIPKEPKTVRSAFTNPVWSQAMLDELQVLYDDNMWTLFPRDPSMSIIGFKWVFKTKLNAYGSLDRLKARLVAKGFHQIDGIDYH